MLTHSKEITRISIEQEMKQSYLDYAMSVIVGRALPDARDGLKPVHRRVLFAMQQLGNDWNKPYKKSARIVGDVIGKYHPHGDSAVYDTIVRMAQPFSLRYLLVDGQGNFGSVDGDAPAAMRYTEIRMSKLAHALLADLEKETVDHVLNYDETEQVPVVLPTRIPNLLVNGSSGIAVGMATNIPPHNLNETIGACIALLDNKEVTIDELMTHLPGPDFPTAGIINGRAGILQAYRTGRGRVLLRAKTNIEINENTGKQAIIVNELPYQVNKARLLEKIGELVKDKKVEGITAIRDESDREGMRIVIEARRGENAEVLLNNLFLQTQLQVTFGINMVALDHGQPRVMNLKELLEAFISHRREVVTRRTIYDLRKARERAHLLEGLAVALANIDHLIALIKGSVSPAEAKEKLLAEVWAPGLVVDLLQQNGSEISRPENLTEGYGLLASGYRLSPAQAQAILDLRLHRLTGLEKEKILQEYQDLLRLIQDLLEILGNPERLIQVIREELLEVKEQFGDARRTQIMESEEDFTMEDLIPEEAVVVTVSHGGYAKTQPITDYQAQKRGGKGKSAAAMKEEDFIEHLIVASTHDTLLCFSNRGKVYWLKTYLLPQASRLARGRPLVNLLPLTEGERISAILSLREYTQNQYVVMATARGTIKKVALPDFSRPRNDGIIAVVLEEGDELVGVDITDGEREIMLFSDAGKVVRFHESHLRPMGRKTRGVRGIRLKSTQRVIAMIIARAEGTILTATANGYGKRTSIEEYRQSARGAQGVISIRVNERNGEVVGALEVADSDELMLISDQGRLIRTRVDEISLVGRSAQGVKLIRLNEAEHLVGIERIVDVQT
ncbi:MAG TPA: DNA gyrase subunit A [Gammaproteobacteria bacterium]|nr:DNA gyrase subunit A [Gammaproteobacteria bacterium]